MPRLDGFVSLEGGANSGTNPSLLPVNQYFFGVNVTARGGNVTNRPGFTKLDLYFADVTTKTRFADNGQGMGVFENPDGSADLIASIGGRIFRIRPDKFNGENVSELSSGLTELHNRRVMKVWMQQARDWFVIQNGRDVPLIYDGAELRYSRPGYPEYEVPCGTAMAFGFGRLFVASPDQTEWAAGDIAGGPTEVINFTEQNNLNETGGFNVPLPGKITSLAVMAVLDTGVGQGNLIVQTPYGAASAAIDQPRTSWLNIGLQKVALLNRGSLSHQSVVLVNGDMFFRAADGIRSLAMARRDFTAKWGNTPISNEVDRVLRLDTEELLQYSQSVLFDNRVITTAAPVMDGLNIFHRGLVVLDLDLISGMSSQAPPAWDGLWTGLNVVAICTGRFNGVERCFVLHWNETDETNEIWELTREDTHDNDTIRIPSFIESRSFAFGSPMQRKRLDMGEFGVDRLSGQVLFDVDYKADRQPLWQDWHTLFLCANRQCDELSTGGCADIVQHHEQYRSRLVLPQPPETDDSGDNKPARDGYEFQVKLAWEGKAQIRWMRLFAEDVDSDPEVTEAQDCRAVTGCPADPYAHNVNSTQGGFLINELGQVLLTEDNQPLTE